MPTINILVGTLTLYPPYKTKYIKDLADWLKFYNKKVSKTFGKPNGLTDYNIEIEYIIPYYSFLKMSPQN